MSTARPRPPLFFPVRAMVTSVRVWEIVPVVELRGPRSGRRRSVFVSLTCPRPAMLFEVSERIGGCAGKGRCR